MPDSFTWRYKIVVRHNELDRRRALLVLGAVSPCFLACVAPPVDSSIDNIDNPGDPDDGDGGNADNPSPSGDDAGSSADASPPTDDVGTVVDTGAGSSTTDSGTSTKTDTGGSSTGGGGGGGTTPTCPSTTDAGAVSSFPVNTWKKVTATRPFIVGHDAGGFYAFSAKCTHHTSVTIGAPNSSGTATCPSHGAQFDSNGNVIRGPASLPLQHYAVTVCGGRIYVDTSKSVSASVRVS